MWAVGLTLVITVMLTSTRAAYHKYKMAGKRREM
jgi:hypothetical protein